VLPTRPRRGIPHHEPGDGGGADEIQATGMHSRDGIDAGAKADANRVKRVRVAFDALSRVVDQPNVLRRGLRIAER
jgi:hypothetical protein